MTTPQANARDTLNRITAALINHQQDIRIDGRQFHPLGMMLEDGSGLRWLLTGYWTGSCAQAQIFIDFTRPGESLRITFPA